MIKYIKDKFSIWMFGKNFRDISKMIELLPYHAALLYHVRCEINCTTWLTILENYRDNPDPWKDKDV